MTLRKKLLQSTHRAAIAPALDTGLGLTALKIAAYKLALDSLLMIYDRAGDFCGFHASVCVM